MDRDRYLERIGLDPTADHPPTRETLSALQSAHVRSVPFETLAVAGHPHADRGGAGVTVDPAACYRKVVERERGGFCYELNGAFGRLLDALGYDAARVPAMVVGSDGDAGPPANHLTHVVSLDRRYVVDVGLGTPPLRRPLPLDGTVVNDAGGVAWRVRGSDRPDADFAVQQRPPGADDWRVRYVFDDRHRGTAYFEASCDYLATAPESPFTGDPVVSLATERGYKKLQPGTLTRVERGDERTREIGPEEWDDVLATEFGIDLR